MCSATHFRVSGVDLQFWALWIGACVCVFFFSFCSSDFLVFWPMPPMETPICHANWTKFLNKQKIRCWTDDIMTQLQRYKCFREFMSRHCTHKSIGLWNYEKIERTSVYLKTRECFCFIWKTTQVNMKLTADIFTFLYIQAHILYTGK